jgi:hypothetical protein
MEMEIDYLEDAASSSKSCTDRSAIVWKYPSIAAIGKRALFLDYPASVVSADV